MPERSVIHELQKNGPSTLGNKTLQQLCGEIEPENGDSVNA